MHFEITVEVSCCFYRKVAASLLVFLPYCVYSLTTKFMPKPMWRFGVFGNINEVTLRRAWLVLGWVTVSEFNSGCEKFVSV